MKPRCLAFALFAILAFPLMAQEAADETEAAFTPEQEKILESMFEVWSEVMIEPRKTHERKRLEALIQTIRDATGLTEEAAKPLVEAMDEAIKQGEGKWIEGVREFTRTTFRQQMLAAGQTADELLKEAEESKEDLKNMGEEELAQTLQFMPLPDNGRPENQAAWTAALKKALTAKQLEAWNEVLATKETARKKFIETAMEQWRQKLETPMLEAFSPVLKRLRETIELEDDRSEALDRLVDESIAESLAEQEKPVRKMIEGMTQERLDTIANGSTSFGGKPAEEPLKSEKWTKGLAKILSEKELADWDQARKEFEEEQAKELADMKDKVFKTRLAALRGQYAQQFDSILTDIRNTLELDEERGEKLKELSEEAMDAFEEVWIEKADDYLEKMPKTQRQDMIRRGYFGMALKDEDLPLNGKAWNDGLQQLLGEDFGRWKTAQERSERRQRESLGRLMIVKLVKVLGLTPEQRKTLLPILSDLGAKRYPPDQFRGRMFSFSTSMFVHIVRDDSAREKVAEHLDEVQASSWRQWVDLQLNSRRSLTVKRKSQEPEPIDDELFREEALSTFLAEMRLRDRTNYLSRKLAEVEDMIRVVALTPEQGAQLTTAAKGTSELALEAGAKSRSKTMHKSVANVPRDQIYARLRQLGGNQFSVQDSEVVKKLWDTTVDRLLTDEQRRLWKDTLAERAAFEKKILRQQLLAQTERTLNLSDDQVNALEPLFEDLLEKYGPDLARRFRSSTDPWYYNSYYSLCLVNGIEEDSLKSLLTEKQFDRWNTEFGPRMTSYWSSIETYHEQRNKKDKPRDANEVDES